jgi:hypothetical protein
MSGDSPSAEHVESAAASDGEADERDSREWSVRRRMVLTGAATWATVGLAGCGQNSGDGADSPTDTDADTDSPTDADPSGSPAPEDYVVTDDMVAGSQGLPESGGLLSANAPTRRFVPGMEAVWKVGVYDADTGDILGSGDLDGVAVNVDGGDTVDLSWSGGEEEWSGSWTIPEDTEPGTFTYTVEVTDGDANVRNVGVLESQFDVISYADPTNYVVTNHTYTWVVPDNSNGFVQQCAPEEEFTTQMPVGFVVGIYDPATGRVVGPDIVDSATITFPDAEFSDIELAWAGDDEENAAREWGGKLELPADTATGTYSYEVVVSGSNGETSFTNVGLAADSFTVIEAGQGTSSGSGS